MLSWLARFEVALALQITSSFPLGPKLTPFDAKRPVLVQNHRSTELIRWWRTLKKVRNSNFGPALPASLNLIARR